MTKRKKRSRGVSLVDIEANLGERIMPMYKALPPYMDFKEGYGYLGVLLIDNETDRIQCHMCGLWFSSLGHHVRSHSITPIEYKLKVGLYKNVSLINISGRNKFRRLAVKNKTWERNLKESNHHTFTKNNVPKKGNGNYAFQHKNKFGTCDEQLRSRLLKTIKEHNTVRIATYNITLYNALKRRFGSYDSALEFYNIKKRSIFTRIYELIN